jgi:hypothetical protein
MSLVAWECDMRHLGLGCDPSHVDAFVSEGRKKTGQEMAAEKAVKPLADGPGRPERENVDGANIRPNGNSASYLVGRLKPDAPEVAAVLVRGEYKSARAAGIAAEFSGLRKLPKSDDVQKRHPGAGPACDIGTSSHRYWRIISPASSRTSSPSSPRGE